MNSHDELQAAEARRASITEMIHNLGAERARLDRRIGELHAEIARAETDMPCWQCSAPPAADIRLALSNGRSMPRSPSGLPQACCRILTFQSRNVSIGVI
jgi:hypothetical protein